MRELDYKKAFEIVEKYFVLNKEGNKYFLHSGIFAYKLTKKEYDLLNKLTHSNKIGITVGDKEYGI